MPAALTATPALDAGLLAAVVVAAGVTALVALGMMLVAMHRAERLTALRGLATAGLAVGVVSMAVGGVLAVSPSSAHASTGTTAPTYVVTTGDEPSLQLPTLSGD